MTVMADSRTMLDQGRLQQFEEMMEQLSSMQAKYKGVRGELLAKVRDELMRLRPGANTTPASTPPAAKVEAKAEVVEAPAPVAPPVLTVVPRPKPTPNPITANALPSCRVCGRSMKQGEVEKTLVCEKGHTRTLA